MEFAKFTYRPIGQGLFYTGQIYQNQKYFNLVYDCGSDNKVSLDDEIDNYLSEIEEDDIDLLCISHFDSDHVNGLEKLLMGVGKVKNLVLPYIHPKDLLLLLPNNPGCLIYTQFGRSNLYKKTLFDKVIFIKDNESDAGNNLDLFSDFYGNVEILSNTEAAKDENIYRFYKYWMFKFFTYTPKRIGESDKELFYDILSEITLKAWGIDIRNIKGMLEWLKIDWKVNKKSPLKGISGNDLYKNAREEFKLKTSKEFTFNNDMSLLCFHEPVSNVKSLIAYSPVYYVKFPFSYRKELVNKGQMLTGDYDFNIDKEQSYLEFKKHYFAELPRIEYMNLSHHGANSNWNAKLLSEVEAKHWITSFGIYNRYGHPHNKPVYDLIDNNSIVTCCNENMAVDIIYFH